MVTESGIHWVLLYVIAGICDFGHNGLAWGWRFTPARPGVINGVKAMGNMRGT